MSFVLDSSVALSWCFRDEQSPQSAETLNMARRRAVFVPSLWHIEMANIMGLSFRKGRLNESDLRIALQVFATLELHTDIAYPSISTSVLLPLMQAYTLTAYDAVYLELALRLDIPLLTLDAHLASSAKQAGVRPIDRQA